MATFPALFKGAAPGTYWHLNDARLSGFMAAATRPHTTNAVLGHITHYSHPSPYLSLSFSFAVARSYALVGPAGPASATNPGYVYEIDLSIVPGCPRPLDTLLEIAKAGHAHEHNGGQDLMLGIADPASGAALTTAVPLPGGRTATPAVSQALRALVFAVRDAEVLLSSVPASCVFQRHSVC
jgi:hypothetical protein